MSGPGALLVQHTDDEGPDLLASWLPPAGLALHPVRPYAGQRVPALHGYRALVVMGGPMGCLDDDWAPWLPTVRRRLRQAVQAGLPTLGVCLGAQLLAVAVGGRVERGAAGPELGSGRVRPRAAAVGDPLFAGLTPLGSAGLPVVQWHWDAVTALPPGAVWLAEGEAYPHQAFRVGPRAWGLQFHPETSLPTLAQWARQDPAGLRAAGLSEAGVLAGVRATATEAGRCWQPVLARFAAQALAGRPGAVGQPA